MLRVPTTSPHLFIKPIAKIVEISAEQSASMIELIIGIQIVFSIK